MAISGEARAFWEILNRALLRCWILGFVVVLIWTALFGLASDFVHQLHGAMFGLSNHELDLIFDCGIGLTKVSVILLFFLPWLSIRTVLRNGMTK